MIEKFLKWWLLVILIMVGFGLAWNFEFFFFLLEHDFTNLGFFILFTFSINTVTTGIKIFKEENDYELQWFFSDALVSVGMIGTVIGFIYMLFSVFGNLDLADSSKLTIALSEMAKGMSTALLTTLTGLVSSILLKFQLVIAQK